jgi:hypothetical protein
MKELTLVWNRPKHSSWEVSWIEYLFRNIPHTTVENLNHDLYLDNSVIIDTLQWAPYHDDYTATLARKACRFGIVHLSDETRQDNISSYQYSRFVLRNYYREGMPSKVMHIPLGYNTGFADIPDNAPSSRRKYIWAFVGERWDSNRNDMFAAMSNVPNGKIYVANHHGPRLDPIDMSRIYRDAVFIPGPHGWWVIDSFRVTEALEAGCIPIIEKSDYWAEIHGADLPFLQINTWSQAPARVQSLMSNPEEVESLRLKCHAWWSRRKDLITQGVEALVARTMV